MYLYHKILIHGTNTRNVLYGFLLNCIFIVGHFIHSTTDHLIISNGVELSVYDSRKTPFLFLFSEKLYGYMNCVKKISIPCIVHWLCVIISL